MKKNEMPDSVKVPKYMAKLYHNAYMKRRWFSRLNNDFFAYLSTLGMYGRLSKAILNEIKEDSSVLVIGNIRGNLIENIAKKLFRYGRLEIVDVLPLQLNFLERKLALYPNTVLTNNDAEFLKNTKYDVVLSYFLLQELPDAKKNRIITNISTLLKPKGKAIFADYGKISSSNPMKYLLLFFNRLLRPFAESMMNLKLTDFAQDNLNLAWNTKTLLKGIYQITTASSLKRNA